MLAPITFEGIHYDTPLFSPYDQETPFSVFESPEDEKVKKEYPLEHDTSINVDTVTQLKRALADTTGIISLYTTLKSTYLKLCKEFNYLLQLFKENERVKLELIKENNDLRQLVAELTGGCDKKNKDCISI